MHQRSRTPGATAAAEAFGTLLDLPKICLETGFFVSLLRNLASKFWDVNTGLFKVVCCSGISPGTKNNKFLTVAKAGGRRRYLVIGRSKHCGHRGTGLSLETFKKSLLKTILLLMMFMMIGLSNICGFIRAPITDRSFFWPESAATADSNNTPLCCSWNNLSAIHLNHMYSFYFHLGFILYLFFVSWTD